MAMTTVKFIPIAGPYFEIIEILYDIAVKTKNLAELIKKTQNKIAVEEAMLIDWNNSIISTIQDLNFQSCKVITLMHEQVYYKFLIYFRLGFYVTWIIYTGSSRCCGVRH